MGDKKLVSSGNHLTDMFAGFIASFPSHNDAEYQRVDIYGESSCCCSDVDARGGY